MNLWNSLAGMVEVELTSADPEGTLAAAAEKNIAVFSVTRKEALVMHLRVFRRDLPALRELCEKRGDRLSVRRTLGIYWTLKRFLARPVLVLGIGLLLFLTLFLPTRVLFVRVEGNSALPDRQILEAAEALGIRFGASRRGVRSERIKNALLGAIPELQWAGVNTRGCTAVISVRERTPEEKAGEEENRVGSVVAARDGVVVSCTVLEGTAKCTPGQAVRQGQVLISGYTDCGICIRAAWAKGEVYARTRREITVITPAEWDERDAQTGSAMRFSLIFGKKRINLWKGSGIWDSSCGRIETEYPLVLPGGFRLPVALAVEKLTFWNTEPTASIEAAAEAELKAFADDYLTSQMVAGKILYAVESVFPQAGGYVLTGQYDCLEMIGRERAEEMGENHGQSD